METGQGLGTTKGFGQPSARRRPNNEGAGHSMAAARVWRRRLKVGGKKLKEEAHTLAHGQQQRPPMIPCCFGAALQRAQ